MSWQEPDSANYTEEMLRKALEEQPKVRPTEQPTEALDYAALENRVLALSGETIRKLMEDMGLELEAFTQHIKEKVMDAKKLPELHLSALPTGSQGPTTRSRRPRWKRSMRDHSTRVKRCGSGRFKR